MHKSNRKKHLNLGDSVYLMGVSIFFFLVGANFKTGHPRISALVKRGESLKPGKTLAFEIMYIGIIYIFYI